MSEKELLLSEMNKFGPNMMNYRANLEWIDWYQRSLKKTFNFSNSIQKMKNKSLKYVLMFFGYMLLIGLFYGIISQTNLYKYEILESIFSIVTQFTFFLLIPGAFLFSKIRNKTKNKADKKKTFNELVEANIKIIRYLRDNKVIIPSKYWSQHSLSRFTDYLTTYRADTLKECVQIYEQELMHNQQLQKLDTMDQKLSKINDGISRIEQELYYIGNEVSYTNVILENPHLYKN